MQPANLDLTLERGDNGRVTFRFEDGAGDPITLGSGEIALELTWPRGSLTLEHDDGLTVDDNEVLWSVEPAHLADAPVGRIAEYRLVRTTVADGRRSYLVGTINITEGVAAGDQGYTVTVDDLVISVAVTEVRYGPFGIGSIDGLQTALDGKADDADVTSLDGRLDTAETKLAGIEDGATANETDAELRDRATHTGEQPIASVTGLQTALDGKASDAELSSEAATRQGADEALDGRLDTVEAALPGKQAADADLTAIAGLTPTDNDFLQRKGGVWVNRSPPQVKADLAIAAGDVSGLAAAADAQIAAQRGVANGLADLDSGGKVPAARLPSYVDDVIEAADLAAFPATGEAGKLYVALDTNKPYRWSGSTYVEISPSPGSTDSLTEGSVNLYHTPARARAAVSADGPLTYDSGSGEFGLDSSGLLDRANHTGEQAIATVTGLQAALDGKADDGDVTALDGRLDTAEGKLAGIEDGATANETDAHLLARANHTGEQAISTVTGLQDALDDALPAPHPGYISTKSYPLVSNHTAVSPGAPADVLRAYMVRVWRPVQLRGLGMLVWNTGAPTAGTDVLAGIYSDLNGRPDTLLAQIATPFTPTTSATYYAQDFASDITLQPGIYWMASLHDTAAVINGWLAAGNATCQEIIGVGTPNTSVAGGSHVEVSRSYGSGLPSTFGTATDGTTAGQAVLLYARVR